MFLPISADFLDLFDWGFCSHKGRSKPRSGEKIPERNHKGLEPQRRFKFSPRMPTDTDADVLRRHGLLVLADWAENALIAPQYQRQLQYWASVLLEPEIPEFAEWPMEGTRGLEFDVNDEAELPEADLPLLVPVFPASPAVVSLNTKKNYPPPVPGQTRPHAQLPPNLYTTGGHSRVHSVLIGIHKCHCGVVFLLT